MADKDIDKINKLWYLLDDVYSTGLIENEERDEYQQALGNVLEELETYKNEIKKYKHSMAMISEICIDESKVHITTREAIEEIRKYIYHGVDIDWARKEVEND